MATIPNHYKALGLVKYVTNRVKIQKAFAARMKALKSGGSKAKEDARNAAIEASRVLSDDTSRKQYDGQLKAERAAIDAIIRAERAQKQANKQTTSVKSRNKTAEQAIQLSAAINQQLEAAKANAKTIAESGGKQIKTETDKKLQTAKSVKETSAALTTANKNAEAARKQAGIDKKAFDADLKEARLATQEKQQATKADKRQTNILIDTKKRAGNMVSTSKSNVKSAEEKVVSSKKNADDKQNEYQSTSKKLGDATKAAESAKSKADSLTAQRQNESAPFLQGNSKPFNATRPQLPNFYKTLGLKENAKPDDIASAFRATMAKLADKSEEARVLAIKANEVLSNSETKSQYDTALKTEQDAIKAVQDSQKAQKNLVKLQGETETAKKVAESAKAAATQAGQQLRSATQKATETEKKCKEMVNKAETQKVATTQRLKDATAKLGPKIQKAQQSKTKVDKSRIDANNKTEIAQKAAAAYNQAKNVDATQNEKVKIVTNQVKATNQQAQKDISNLQNKADKASKTATVTTSKAQKEYKSYEQVAGKAQSEMKTVNENKQKMNGAALPDAMEKRRRAVETQQQDKFKAKPLVTHYTSKPIKGPELPNNDNTHQKRMK